MGDRTQRHTIGGRGGEVQREAKDGRRANAGVIPRPPDGEGIAKKKPAHRANSF
jgi:hypothetical protein